MQMIYILRVARDIARKASCMFVTFAGVDPFVTTRLAISVFLLAITIIIMGRLPATESFM